ncbi:hypothetical protein NT017_17420 [Prolixibacter sp. NT017]|nr:hypothetical protein NT017_17420 [Prolixibacter sp. NT017]
MDVHIKNNEKKIVVQGLFSDEKGWDIVLLTTKNMTQNIDTYIKNATVEIASGTDPIIRLHYTKFGHYQSEQKPVAGKVYTLKIDVPGYDQINAQSSIPLPVKAKVDDFTINWLTYMYPNDLLDYDVFPLTVRFEKPVPDANMVFRAKKFNPESGYNRYLLPSSAVKELEQQGIPPLAATRLRQVADQWQISRDVFEKCFNGTEAYTEITNHYNMLREKLRKKTVKQREYAAFEPTQCFANDNRTSNISYDTNTVFGQGQQVVEAGLLYADPNLKYDMQYNYGSKPGIEYWLEVTQGSIDYYEYYRTYILQISQRLNPYSGPVEVYSNINNGVGIFAGYHRQMIHILTY